MDKNTLFFLIPKEQVEYLLGSDTVKQVLEKMENTQKAYPMIAKRL